MTREEALKLKSFKRYCNCGGFACSMNGRPKNNPHMPWCNQYEEWQEWHHAINKKGKG